MKRLLAAWLATGPALELMELAKANPTKVNFGPTGWGTAAHMQMSERFQREVIAG